MVPSQKFGLQWRLKKNKESFVEDRTKVESMLKENVTAFSEADNTFFGPKYKELVARYLDSKK